MIIIQFVDTMTNYLTWSLPLVFLVFPCIILYLQLMASVTQRPVASGLDLNKENVRLALLTLQWHSDPLYLRGSSFFIFTDEEEENKPYDCRGHHDTSHHFW